MNERVFNFSPGPAVLPLPVLQEIQRDLLCLPGQGCSVLEISHRSPWFEGVVDEAIGNLRTLLGLPANYQVVFLQGGARLQFAMAPMNLLGPGGSADYVITGSWGKMAAEEALKIGTVRTAYNGKSHNYSRLPQPAELDLDPQAAFVHITSNETIQGVQFPADHGIGSAPVVCDASSDILSRPLPMDRYGLIYACAQKNAGPAGVTVAIIRDDLLARSSEQLPTMLNYAAVAKENSLLNTPPVFPIYALLLITRWLKQDIGGLAKMEEQNRYKARLLYDAIDSSEGFYQGHAAPECRSLMNVTFRLPDAEADKAFLKQAEARGLAALKGHRSVGGMRASIYNAMPLEGVERLRDFMVEFRKSR